MEKLDRKYLNVFETHDSTKYFGDWVRDIDVYRESFLEGKPFKNVVIPNFLNADVIENIHNEFPCDFNKNIDWFHYNNPLEVKYLNSAINNMPMCIRDVYYALSTTQMTNLISNMTGIQELECDPTLYGSSIHAHGRHGRLNLHLDYEKHPLLPNKERRINIILFLNKDWKREWNGHSELWNENVTECIKKQCVVYNTAFIFQTNDISWHGVPEKIMCPANHYRKTLAYYYISPLVSKPDTKKFGCDSSGHRTKASFIKRPQDKDYPELQKLYSIRPHRRITHEDMSRIWPEWTPEIF